MRWRKQGVIFQTNRQQPWMVSHAGVPTALLIGERIRLYFAARTAQNQSLPTFIDVDAEDPRRILAVHDRPLLELGELGTFDDGGIMPCAAVAIDGRIYLYYTGWNPSVSVPYRNAIGVAVSDDGGTTFRRLFPGAIVDRSMDEPFFTATPWVMRDGERRHMWYASATRFVRAGGRVEPVYVIKYAASSDGLYWQRENITCIAPRDDEEANARPSVLKDGDRYRMLYCYRGSRDYRDGADSYRLGYAESTDARCWRRCDDAFAWIGESDGWDARMQAYPCWLRTPRATFLFYNGNGFGLTGIGLAVLRDGI